MLILALLLQSAPLVQLGDRPQPDRNAVLACRAAYDRLDGVLSRFNEIVWQSDVDRGGSLTWSEASDVRHAANTVTRPYLERIRRIAWEGREPECNAIAQEGQTALLKGVILPFRGR